MTFLAILLIIVVIAVSIWLMFGRGSHPIDKLPGPPTWPIIGNVLEFLENEQMLSNFQKFSAKYWPIYRTWIINIPTIHPHSPNDLETILTSSQHITKSHEYNFLSEWLGTGLLTSRGAKWHKRRKMLTPAFHFKILEEFIPTFNGNTKILISKLQEVVGKSGGVDIVPLVTHCALDIICETAMGTAINAQKDKDSEYVSAMYELNDIIVYRAFRPWFYPGWIWRLTRIGRRHDQLIALLHKFTKKVIRERKVERQLNKNKAEEEVKAEDEGFFGAKKKTAFLDLLLDVKDGDASMTDEDIREEVDTFMFEGHDTTAMAMSWSLFFIGCHQDVQDKCVEELQEIFGDSDRQPSMTDLGSMKYIERVIKESLRLRPSVYFIARRLDTTLKLGKNEFPAGTRINIHIQSIHRNPEVFPNPDKFEPDRFLPENTVGRHPYSYIPFSAGPRNCIGQKFAMLEMKSLLSTVLRHYKIEALNPVKDAEIYPDVIYRPKNGLHMKILPRNLIK